MNDLKAGLVVGWQGEPFGVLEAKHLHLARGAGVVQAKLKNLKTGKVLSPTFKPSDQFEELEVKKVAARFLYEHRGVSWFANPGNPSQRFSLPSEAVGEPFRFLKPQTIVEAVRIQGEIVNVSLPIKVALKVVEAAPSIKGETQDRSTKTVKLESGAEISAPLFINEGDVILVNTQTGEYVERAEKA